MKTKIRTKIVFISHSRAVAQILNTLAPSLGISIETHFAAMERAVVVAHELFSRGVDVVLSSGNTGDMLAKQLGSSVVNISPTHFDYLQALQHARERVTEVGMPFFEQVPEGLSILSDVLHLRVIPVIFHDTASLVSSINTCANQGIRCIVGGHVAVEIARAQGCMGVEVHYSEQEVLRSLQEVEMVTTMRTRDATRKAMLLRVAEMVPDKGIVGIDEEGDILFWNSCTDALLKCSPPDTKAQEYMRSLGVLNTLQQGSEQTTLVKMPDERQINTTSQLVTVNGTVCGVVAVMQSLSKKTLRGALRQGNFKSRYSLEDLVGASPIMQSTLKNAQIYAQTDASLLIHGETGSGKELLAHAIHDASPRRHAPFVALNCAALTESLLESELFGYEDGAFTGARRGGKDGIFMLAQGGTVFLDEIADISPGVQVRLLRVLEAKEIMRVGGDCNISVDVRILSSSWKRLIMEVHSGRFRADLYYRLSVLALELPPLRERLEDIPLIAEAILKRHQMSHKRISAHAYTAMKSYTWPGNIRELDALLQRYCLLLHGEGPDDRLMLSILDELRATSRVLEKGSDTMDEDGFSCLGKDALGPSKGELKEQMKFYEQMVIQNALKANQYNRELTARQLGISRNSLWLKIKNSNIESDALIPPAL